MRDRSLDMISDSITAVNIVIVTFNGLLVSGHQCHCRRHHRMAARIHNTLITESLTSRQGHSHEKLLGKGQHSLSLGDDSHAHPVWSWSLVSPPIMVSITSCVAPSALVSACIMPSHTSHEGKSHGLRSASARTDGGHWAMCPPQGRTENWLSRCVTLSCLQQSQLPAQAAHCSGRSVLAGLRPPAHHGLGSLSRVYIRDWPGGIKTAIKEELILSMNNGMLRSVSKMSYDQ